MTSIFLPELTDEQGFYKVIKQLASSEENLCMLEIGSSTGLGSTRAFIDGILIRQDHENIRLYCLEMFEPAYRELLENTRDYPFIRAYNENSIALEEMPSWDDVVDFYQTTRTYLNNYPIETVSDWYQRGLVYAEQTGLKHNGIKKIKRENGIINFDLVLIDGSEFTGEQDLYSCMGAKTIMLDDCMTYKCFHAYHSLLSHHSYDLSFANMDERHGFAVFRRRY
jgi:hypothetical protein